MPIENPTSVLPDFKYTWDLEEGEVHSTRVLQALNGRSQRKGYFPDEGYPIFNGSTGPLDQKQRQQLRDFMRSVRGSLFPFYFFKTRPENFISKQVGNISGIGNLVIDYKDITATLDEIPALLTCSVGGVDKTIVITESGQNAPMSLVASGNGVVFSSNSIGKSTGGASFNGGVHSSEGYLEDLYTSFKFNLTSMAGGAGFNADASAGSGITDIDYAWYAESAVMRILESGTQVLTDGAYTTSDVFKITYDGVNVKYYKNSTLKRTIARALGSPLFFDSSFLTESASAQISEVLFQPDPDPYGRARITFTAGIQTGIVLLTFAGRPMFAGRFDMDSMMWKFMQNAASVLTSFSVRIRGV